MFPLWNRHQLWKSAVPKWIELPVPDWSHFKEFQPLLKMGPIWLLWLYSLWSSILQKIVLIFRWENFYFLDKIVLFSTKSRDSIHGENLGLFSFYKRRFCSPRLHNSFISSLLLIPSIIHAGEWAGWEKSTFLLFFERRWSNERTKRPVELSMEKTGGQKASFKVPSLRLRRPFKVGASEGGGHMR